MVVIQVESEIYQGMTTTSHKGKNVALLFRAWKKVLGIDVISFVWVYYVFIHR